MLRTGPWPVKVSSLQRCLKMPRGLSLGLRFHTGRGAIQAPWRRRYTVAGRRQKALALARGASLTASISVARPTTPNPDW